ncbi:MAG TPA: hypothetical protein VEL68_09590 [Thermodesulfobacteriota bacterium]|nr:hypothetical protein [Thermodesulfobacteriota bacterium]
MGQESQGQEADKEGQEGKAKQISRITPNKNKSTFPLGNNDGEAKEATVISKSKGKEDDNEGMREP